jgi:hypothetical protein
MVRRDRLTRLSHPRQTVFWGLPSGGDGAEIATGRDLGRIIKEVEPIAGVLGLTYRILQVRGLEDFEPSFASMRAWPV